MGVKGLQYFMDRCCPEACVTVHLKEMAKQHAAQSSQGNTTATNRNSSTLVVDGMACLCHWYSCKEWVSGGQWKEYMDVLKTWVEAFTLAGIRLVFFFDGVVEEKKRPEWVKRRHRVNGEVSKIFSHIKAHGEQPGGKLFSLPSGLATFTRFALKSLGQEVFCSVMEADYEIAHYACQHNCMGILGQDTDFIIFDSAPYLSVSKLRTDNLTTVLYDRQRLCQAIGLAVYQLPLLACLLGNDVVSEERIQHIQKNALTTYRQIRPPSHPSAQQGQMVFAISHFLSFLWDSNEDVDGLIPSSLKLSPSDKDLLESGIRSYLLPEQKTRQFGDAGDNPTAYVYQKYVSANILKACREKHVAAEDYFVYSVVFEGVVESSNSLEDEEDTELLPQALVYKLCRQRIYGLLLLHNHDGSNVNPPAVKEWFVYPGNPLKEPEMVPPVPLNLQCDHPGLDLLWFGNGHEVTALRLAFFLAIFDCQDFSELYAAVEEHIFAAICLVTYIVIQVPTLSQEDVDAYLSQAVCLGRKSPQELQQIKLPFHCSRAVQLGSLYVRGLGHLLGANCASGCPLSRDALMPWNSFDGRLFHSKYLLAHNSAEDTVLLDSDSSCLDLFHHLRAKVKDACLKKGRVLQSRPRRHTLQLSHKTSVEPRYRDRHAGSEGWRSGSEPRGGYHSAEGWRGDVSRRQHEDNRERWERGYYPTGSQQFEFYSQQSHDGRGQNNRGPQRQSRGRFNRKGRYHLAPRWSQPP